MSAPVQAPALRVAPVQSAPARGRLDAPPRRVPAPASPAAGAPAVVPEATVARLPGYLGALHALAEQGRTTVSSADLAQGTGVGAAMLRKDLAHLGSCGTRGVGYDVAELVARISRALGLGRRWPVVLVGAGHLGTALSGYAGFAGRGFEVVAVLDADPGRVGEQVGSLVVRPVAELEKCVRALSVAIGVIATPAGTAQRVCDQMVAAGLTSVLSFAPVALQVPAGVDVRRVDLSNELQILAFHAERRAGTQHLATVPA